jgi:pimeloyl-ACP methyl ester carboxylesterase
MTFYAGLVEAPDISQLHWVGTAMGGALGLRLAATALKGRISRLVLNDIGPTLGMAALARIREYAGKPPRFDRIAELEKYFRTVISRSDTSPMRNGAGLPRRRCAATMTAASRRITIPT